MYKLRVLIVEPETESMTLARTILRKILLSGLVLLTLGTGVMVPILDRETITSNPHLDGPKDRTCAPYAHNHAICVVLAVSPVLVTQSRQPDGGRSAVIAHPITSPDLAAAPGYPGNTRSRAPPHA